ncbi:MAG: hypothetical protein IJL17_21265 [Kiritimatiellae bacterium]|nr:hypothetical protein [Kiritimatiellia bacterium]
MRVKIRGAYARSVFAVACAAMWTVHAEVTVTQTLTLNSGWNAVYVEVSPTAPLTEVFADWPVKSVGFYDPASFLATRQFSQTWDSLGVSMKPIAMWHRDYPEASRVERIPAGSVCLVYNTNGTRTVVSVMGVPAAPRMTWHVTDTNEVYNFVGFSLQAGASILPRDYLKGFDGNVLNGSFFKFGGSNPDAAPQVMAIYQTTKVSDGDVLLIASDRQSDWSGALYVSPMTGLDFGSDQSQVTLSVRNDGEDGRTVAVDMVCDPAYGEISLPRAAVHVRDAAVALTNAAWTALSDGESAVARKWLAAGETWRIEFGLDRTVFDTGARGRKFGALLRVTDVDGASKMRVDVPLAGETSGESATSRTWPGGLWVADVAFNRIVAPGSPAETETGGTAKLRLPVHVDATGKLRLLQRVVSAGEVATDGTYAYRLYAGTATVPTTANVAMRISAVCLPTELPVVESTGGTFSTNGVTFAFAVAGDGATSLLRHPLHPQHDGLRWDFKTPAPSGDEFSNYKGDVKPETFSVQNEINLMFSLNGGEAPWNSEQTKSGTCRWKLTNLMRQGPITLVGDMTIKRVSTQTEIILQ